MYFQFAYLSKGGRELGDGSLPFDLSGLKFGECFVHLIDGAISGVGESALNLSDGEGCRFQFFQSGYSR